MISPVKKMNISPDQVKQDIQNVITVLQALDTVIPNKIDAELIAALQAVESNDWLLQLLTNALGRL